jgi:hypothetical protein
LGITAYKFEELYDVFDELCYQAENSDGSEESDIFNDCVSSRDKCTPTDGHTKTSRQERQQKIDRLTQTKKELKETLHNTEHVNKKVIVNGVKLTVKTCTSFWPKKERFDRKTHQFLVGLSNGEIDFFRNTPQIPMKVFDGLRGYTDLWAKFCTTRFHNPYCDL